jgi:hypothetical protein
LKNAIKRLNQENIMRHALISTTLLAITSALSACNSADADSNGAKNTQPSSLTQDSAAVAVARAHIDAWSRHDWNKARESLAPAVHVTVSTTLPGLPPTDTTGDDKYMVGLKNFAGAVIPGTTRIVSSTGDDRNALITLTVRANFGQGDVEVPAARMYLLDEKHRIANEQVIFFMAPLPRAEAAAQPATTYGMRTAQ